ncbi:MAG: response regulator [Acidobacteria bacterium]|nr:response regulator [Acidobacteriota bacterium]
MVRLCASITFVLILPALQAKVPAAASIADARKIARQAGPAQYCFTGIVTLETGGLTSSPSDYYFQDETGGIAVHGTGQQHLARGTVVRTCGSLRLQDGLEPELVAATEETTGKHAPLPPRRITVDQAIRGEHAGELVQVEGEVLTYMIGESRDTLLLGPHQPPLRVYGRRPVNQATAIPTVAPMGSRITVAGILLPDDRTSFQIRLRSSSDIVLVAMPLPAEIRVLRIGVTVCAGLVMAFLLWSFTLRRAVRRQTTEIRELMVKAQESSRLKAEFLANMSHEVRTPLNGIIGMTELALDTPLTTEQRSYLDTVRSASLSLLAIVNDILDFSRMEKKGLPIVHEPFSLEETLGCLRPLFEVSASTKGLRLEIRTGPGVPSRVMGDCSRLRQVLVNLVGNAVKFTAAGAVSLQVSAAGKNRLRFEVADTGIGIQPEQQSTIFDAFSQGDAAINREYGGSGLGLTISAQLVRLMGGEIEVKSEPGAGSTFSFSLPLPAIEAATSECAVPAEESFQKSLQSMASILVVEDNPVNQKLVSRMLEKRGHAVDVAANGVEAAEKACNGKFDLIFMDVQMPVADGFEATSRIRGWEKETGATPIPIVALTAHALPEYARLCRDAGMDDYLSKPFRPDDLDRILAQHLQRGRARRPLLARQEHAPADNNTI